MVKFRVNKNNNKSAVATQPASGVPAPQQVQNVQRPEVSAKVAARNIQAKSNVTNTIVKKWWLILITVFSAVIIALAAFFIISKFRNTEVVEYRNVEIGSRFPSASPLGSTREYKIDILNNNEVDIRDIKVEVNMDNDFQYEKSGSGNSTDDDTYYIDKINAGSASLVSFEGFLLGGIGENSPFSYSVEYSADVDGKTETVFQQFDEEIVRITPPELEVQISASQDLVEYNNDFNINLKIANLSDQVFKKVRLRANYPAERDYEYKKSILRIGSQNTESPSEKNNVWYVDDLPRKSNQTLDITGRALDAGAEDLTFDFDIAILDNQNNWTVLTDVTKKIKTLPQSLAVNANINSKENVKLFNPAEQLQFSVSVENKSTKTIDDVRLAVEVIDPLNALDMSSATFNTSKPRVSGNNLEWTGLNNAELLSLQPGASVVYDFGIKIKDKSEYLKTTATAEDYKIEVLAEAQSGQLEPVQSLSQTIYSTGDLAFSQTVELKEQNAEDTKRIYNVKWEFSNQQTEYSDVVINTGTGLEDAWDEVIIEPAELKDLFDYNPSSGKITMRQDKIEPYSGISTDQFVVSFDLAVELESFDASAETDADSDEDEEQADNSELYRDIELLRETTVTAKDVFTQIEFETKESPVVIK